MDERIVDKELKPPYIFPQKSREDRGRRELYGDTHYDACDGTTCPCYVEGRKDMVWQDKK